MRYLIKCLDSSIRAMVLEGYMVVAPSMAAQYDFISYCMYAFKRWFCLVFVQYINNVNNGHCTSFLSQVSNISMGKYYAKFVYN